MAHSPDIFFMATPGYLQEHFWRGPSRQRAAALGYEVRLNPREAPSDPADWADLLAGVEALLTTWGSPRLDEAVLARNTTLRIVGHVGGSVATIASPALFERGVHLCTANPIMARTVAEWALMMTLVGLRGLVGYAQVGAGGDLDWPQRHTNRIPEEATVGIWGYGDVARRLIELLRPLGFGRIAVCDEYLTAQTAAAEGLDKVDFDCLFAEADVVHCLVGLTEANKGQVGADQLAALRDGTTLINCGRAALVQEDALIAALGEGRFSAIMDVFEAEPLADDHPYRDLPNVILTPHNAGFGRDAYYLGAMLDEFGRHFRGEPLQLEVTAERALAMTDASLMRGR